MSEDELGFTMLRHDKTLSDVRHIVKVNVAASGRLQISKTAFQEMDKWIYIRVFYDTQAEALCLEPFYTELENCYRVSATKGSDFSADTTGLQNHLKPGNYEYREELSGTGQYVFIRESYEADK